jgi:hypothetical protein
MPSPHRVADAVAYSCFVALVTARNHPGAGYTLDASDRAPSTSTFLRSTSDADGKCARDVDADVLERQRTLQGNGDRHRVSLRNEQSWISGQIIAPPPWIHRAD